jgi:hypothetical protein
VFSLFLCALCGSLSPGRHKQIRQLAGSVDGAAKFGEMNIIFSRSMKIQKKHHEIRKNLLTTYY